MMAASAPVQLYIKILEARGIKGVEKNGNSDPFVEIWVGKDKKKPLKTKVYDDTLTPQWHEEFIFTLPNCSQPIGFQVYDYNKIFKNVSLGQAFLDPATINPNIPVEMWIPLNTQGEIHIFVQPTPLPAAPSKPSAVRLGSFRMIVERTIYFPGEVVRGAIIYNVGKPKKIRGVRVRFDGHTRTYWSESRGSGDDRRTVVFSAAYSYFNPVATLYGNPRGKKDDFKIPSGGYFWPFEFVLPVNLAPSFLHDIGRNSYTIKGYVDIPMAIDKTVNQKLTMTVQYGTLQPTLNLKFSKKAKALLASNQNIEVSLAAPPVAYMGEGFPVDMAISNKGTKEVKEVLLTLKVKYYFTGRSSSEGWKTRKVKKVVGTNQVKGIAGFPIQPGTNWNGQIQFVMPTAVAPSVPEQNSPLVQVVYTLSAKTSTSGNVLTKASSTKKFPLLLGERIPQMAPLPPPAAPPSQILLAPAPDDVYKYLAPPPMVQGEVPVCGPVVPHEAFIAPTAYQPEQWLEPEDGAVPYDPAMAPIESTLSDVQ